MYVNSGQTVIRRMISFRDRAPYGGGSGMPCGACREFLMQLSPENRNMEILLDLADILRKGEFPTDTVVTPHLENRGIKFNIPLDARTPSYSDASTSATRNVPHMWEKEFRYEFLDRMAENKYNVLSLWTLSRSRRWFEYRDFRMHVSMMLRLRPGHSMQH